MTEVTVAVPSVLRLAYGKPKYSVKSDSPPSPLLQKVHAKQLIYSWLSGRKTHSWQKQEKKTKRATYPCSYLDCFNSKINYNISKRVGVWILGNLTLLGAPILFKIYFCFKTVSWLNKLQCRTQNGVSTIHFVPQETPYTDVTFSWQHPLSSKPLCFSRQLPCWVELSLLGRNVL